MAGNVDLDVWSNRRYQRARQLNILGGSLLDLANDVAREGSKGQFDAVTFQPEWTKIGDWPMFLVQVTKPYAKAGTQT
ncbi:hypothetical protein WI97_04310 [Burkholderia vietnamiensis]|nr:hypothetical protein WI97_04310 [Burkholderia vietnamiensis]